ncbi:hypothetical protein ACLI1A_14410 [Flavobacterium sp. RHBU_3]|uniref:hypothetical protein n=1 Tax=Flavobacterium sp. RHBU_3 TaxID=3391184 RepID=UPI003984D810
MKKIFIIAVLITATAGFAQQKKLSFTAIPQDSLKLKLPDFSYFSKNYESVFGRFQYTFDRGAINNRSIYAAPDGNYYSLGDGRYVPTMPIAGNSPLFYNYQGGDIVSGIINAITGTNTEIYIFKSNK